jgi:hypothetical protein
VRVVVTPGSLEWKSNSLPLGQVAQMGTFLLVVEAFPGSLKYNRVTSGGRKKYSCSRVQGLVLADTP